METISARPNNLKRSFFKRISCSADCMKYLLPNERPVEVIEVIDRLQRASKLPRIECRTERYFKSFLPQAVCTYHKF